MSYVVCNRTPISWGAKSRAMLDHYTHVRMPKMRRALEAIDPNHDTIALVGETDPRIAETNGVQPKSKPPSSDTAATLEAILERLDRLER